MVRGMDHIEKKKKPWKNQIERDIILHKDLIEAYCQKGKVMGDIADKVVNKPKKKLKNK